MEKTSLEATAVRSVGLLIGRTLGLQLFTVAATIVLARLLSPRDYGAFAVASALQQVLRSAELSLPFPLIRREEPPTRDEERAVTGFTLMLGGAVAAVAVAVAFLALPTLGVESKTARVIALATLALPIFSFRAVPMILLERSLRFGRLVAVEATETIAFYAFALPAAALGLGAYSLGAAIPVGAAASVAVANVVARWPLGVRLDLGPIRPLASFGAQVSVTYTLQLVRELGLVAVFAAVGGPALAGFYNFSQRIFSLPTAVQVAVQRVGFPALARAEAGCGRARRAAQAASAAAVAVGCLLALVVAAADPLVAILFGERWLPTADIVLAAAVGVIAVTSAGAALSSLAFANADPRTPLLAAIAGLVVGVAAALALVPPLDAVGAGIASGGALLASTLVVFARAPAEARACGPRIARALVAATLAAAAGRIAASGLGPAAFFTAVGVAGGVWLVVSLVLSRAELSLLVRLACRALGRGAA